MTEQHPITPPPELVLQWLEDSPEDDEFGIAGHIATQAARWGADQQLDQDAKWLDTNALFSHNLTITPSGGALRQVMRPKPPSLAEPALAALKRQSTRSVPSLVATEDCDTIRRALERLQELEKGNE